MVKLTIHNSQPFFRREIHFFDNEVIGIDEVGRGASAGPVVAAAVMLPKDYIDLHNLKDSKMLSHRQRIKLCENLEKYTRLGIGSASVEEIDKMNILNATMLAMRRALSFIEMHDYKEILIDGNKNPFPENPKARTVIKGDTIHPSISAASIVAKVYRDTLMDELSKIPEHRVYDWHSNKGYATKSHRIGILMRGPTIHHRQKFIRNVVKDS